MKVLVFAGTTEGKEVSSFLSENGIFVTACVATEYGNMVMPTNDRLEVKTGRLEVEQMAELMQDCVLVIDATHPYACVVTNNIGIACLKTNKEYIRLLRPSILANNVITVRDVREAVRYLNTIDGNVLLTAGSKELELYTDVKNFENRLYVRVLPTPDVVKKCTDLGFIGKNLICMQGPFSHELNVAMLKHISAKYLVTKDTGYAGGFEEKISAANEVGVSVILISRPQEEEGYTIIQLKELLAVRFGF
jgi:precorrin-6x reductase